MPASIRSEAIGSRLGPSATMPSHGTPWMSASLHQEHRNAGLWRVQKSQILARGPGYNRLLGHWPTKDVKRAGTPPTTGSQPLESRSSQPATPMAAKVTRARGWRGWRVE